MKDMAQESKTILFLQTGSAVLARRKLAGVMDFARRVNWRVVVPERPPTGYDVRQLLQSYRPDGIIAECSGPHRELTGLAVNGTPIVYLCRDPREVTAYADVVTNDSPACGRIAARAFAEAGVRTLAFVGSHHSVYWSDRKRDGFFSAARELGFSAIEFPARTTDANRPLAWRRRLAAWLRTLPRPFGVFTVSDEFGTSLVDACCVAGLKVPVDASIIAVNDDETLCESCNPTLSSIRLDYEQTGRIAAERLFGRLTVTHTAAGTATSIPPVGLTRRGSICVATRKDSESIRAIEYVRLHATEGISASDVISCYGCSRRTAERRFTAAAGCTPTEAIVRARIERAKELLRHGGNQTGAIANLAGWRSETLFRRQFKNATGTTPAKYRRTIR